MQSTNETEEAAEKVGRKLSIGSQKTLGDDFDGNGDGESDDDGDGDGVRQ